MVLTASGRSLLPTAREVVAAVESAELDIAKRSNGERGELRLGTQCIFCYKWLPKVMKGLQEKFPLVEMSIGNVSDLKKDLLDERYDLVISGAAADKKLFTSNPLFEDELLCLMHRNHHLAAHRHVEFADFAGENLISHTEHDKNRFHLQVLKPRGIEPANILPIGVPQAMFEMIESRFGIGLFPGWAVRDNLAKTSVVAKRITVRGMPMTWHAIHRREMRVPQYLKEFISLISVSDILRNS